MAEPALHDKCTGKEVTLAQTHMSVLGGSVQGCPIKCCCEGTPSKGSTARADLWAGGRKGRRPSTFPTQVLHRVCPLWHCRCAQRRRHKAMREGGGRNNACMVRSQYSRIASTMAKL